MEPFNDTETSTPQRILIGIGTLVVIILTVVAAIFLARQDLPEEEVTPIVQISPTPLIVTPTPLPATSTFTATPQPPPPTSTATVTPTPQPPPATTEVPPTATDTPIAAPPTATPTPVVIIVTPTPLPDTGEICPPPPTWLAYQVRVGDTLNSLAARTNTSVFELQQANCLETFTITPGQLIHLPFTPPTLTPTPIPTATKGSQPTPTRTPTPIAPFINNVVPDRVDADSEEVIITVIGRNFEPRESGFKAELRGPQNVILDIIEGGSSTSFDAIVPAGLPVGTYDVVVTNVHGRSGVRESAFIIGEAPPTPTEAPGPRIDDVDPEIGFNDRDVTIEVRGRNFRPTEIGFQVQLRVGDDIRAELELIGAMSSTSFNAVVPAGLAPNLYDLWVINPDGKEDVEPSAYESITP